MRNRVVYFILIALNIGIFIWMAATGTPIFQPTPMELFAWGGSSTDALMQGEWWRLITCMFLHCGILHLLMNMYALNFIGSLLEPTIGKTRLVIAYFSTGILASLASGIYHADTYTISVGASGAIFGLFGVLFALLTTKFFAQEIRESLGKSIATTLIINLVYGFQGGIDFAAHIGGLLAGMIVGYCLYPSLIRPKLTLATLSSIALLTLITTSLSLRSLKNDPFHALKQEFLVNDQKIDDWVDSMASLPIWQAVVYLDKFLIPEWERRKTIADKMNQLNLSGDKAKLRNYLVEFTYLQTERLHLMAKSIKENSSVYDTRISEIDSLLSSLTP